MYQYLMIISTNIFLLIFRTTWTVWPQTGWDVAKQSDQRTQRSRDLQSRSSEKRTGVLLQNSRSASIPQISECSRNAKNFLLEIRKPRASTTYYRKTVCVISGLKRHAARWRACRLLRKFCTINSHKSTLPYFLRLVRDVLLHNMETHFPTYHLSNWQRRQRFSAFSKLDFKVSGNVNIRGC